jgi:hypothetical protein
LPPGLSSTNGWRIHVSTFSCTISLESVNVAAASAGTSVAGIGGRRRAESAVPASSAA